MPFSITQILPGDPLSAKSKHPNHKHQDINSAESIHRRDTNTIPTNAEINAARLQEGAMIARNEADELLLDPDQRAQNQRDEALLPPPENTAAMAQLFLRHFGGDAQPPTADHTGPPINSCPGQHPSIASTQQWRVITTTAHARVGSKHLLQLPKRQIGST